MSFKTKTAIKEKLFGRRVIDSNNCWLLSGLDPANYAQTYFDGAYYQTHRLAYWLLVGEIPAGKFVLHRCDVPGCFNPEHLFIGTQLDNMRDMAAKGRNWRRTHANRRLENL